MISTDEIAEMVRSREEHLKGIRETLNELSDPLSADDHYRGLNHVLLNLEITLAILDRLSLRYLAEDRHYLAICITRIKAFMRHQVGAPERLS
jgi:hypothetical protein